MSSFTNDELNNILTRGFKGKEFPLIPVMGYRKSAAGVSDWYDWEESPQVLFNLGDVQEWAGGVGRTEDHILWESDIAVDATGIYNGAKKLKLKIRPRQIAGNNATICWTDENGTELSDIWILNDFAVSPTNTSIRIGDLKIILFYADNRNEMTFGVTYTELKSYSVIPETIYSITPINDFGHSGNFIPNEPFKLFITEGDPDWYDNESQVPELGEGGGGGGFYRNSDTDWFSPLPSLNVLSYGFISQYKLSQADALSLSQYLWSDNFIDNIKKAWQSPFDNIISLAIVPLNAELPTIQSNIKIGNLDTSIGSDKITINLVKKNFGHINLKEMYKNFADYAPFTRLNLYLPAVGIKTVNPDDYMDGELHLEANIDTFSGTIVYQIGSVRHGKKHIVDHYEGSIVTQIPITGASFIDMYKNIISGIATVTSGAMMGSALAVPLTKGASAASKAMHTANQANNIINTGTSVSNGILNIKPTYEKTGSVSGSAMRLSMQTPYLFFDTPQLAQGKNFRQLHGYVSNQYEQLKNCKGFTSIKYMDIQNIDLTDDEKSELEDILTSGVYIN